jgi:predicted transcriptional regulator
MELKVKEIKIIIRPPNDDFDEIANAFKKIEKGEDLKDEKIVVESLDALRKILTPERLMLIHVIKTNMPESIYELAKILRRDEHSVTRDLEHLKLLGLVEFEENKDIRDKKKPIVTYDEIVISIPVVT